MHRVIDIANLPHHRTVRAQQAERRLWQIGQHSEFGRVEDVFADTSLRAGLLVPVKRFGQPLRRQPGIFAAQCVLRADLPDARHLVGHVHLYALPCAVASKQVRR